MLEPFWDLEEQIAPVHVQMAQYAKKPIQIFLNSNSGNANVMKEHVPLNLYTMVNLILNKAWDTLET